MTNGHPLPETRTTNHLEERTKKMKQIYKVIKTLLILTTLTLGAWNSNAWGNTVSVSGSGFNNKLSNNVVTLGGNHVSFRFESSSISYTKNILGSVTGIELATLDKGKSVSGNLKWTLNGGLTLAIQSVRVVASNSYAATLYIDDGKGHTVNQSKSGLGNDYDKSLTTISSSSTGVEIKFTSTVSSKYSTCKPQITTIEVTYTITPNNPGASSEEKTIYVTIDKDNIANDEKLQLNTSDCFTVPDNDSHFYSSLSYYRSAETGLNATTDANVSNNYFNATKVGTYYVKAKISAVNNCHAASGDYSGNITINVIRHPSSITMNNGEVFVKVKDNVAASQLDLDDLIKSQVGDGVVSYTVTSANSSKATIGTGNIFSATDCGEYTISARAQQSALYAQSDPVSFKVTVKKIKPSVTTLPAASAISYHQTISNSNFSGGAVTWNGYTVAGTFSWKNGSLAPGAGNSCEAVFTPLDETRFEKPDNCFVNVPINPIDQTITWNLDEDDEYISGTVFDAVATSHVDGLNVYYTIDASQSQIAEMQGNVLIVKQTNKTVTVYAHQDGNDNWNAAPVVSKNVKTCGAKPDNWSVTAKDITYGQTLAESELTGEVRLGEVVIAGQLSWKVPATLPDAGKHENEYDVVFTPEDGNTYGSVTFKVTVNVNKANPELTWHINHSLRENTNYSNFVTSTNKAALTISTNNNNLLQVNDNVLKTGSVESATNCTIYVSQAATKNYNAIEQVSWAVTIRPKVNVCLPVTLNGDLMEDMTIASTKASWCGTNEQGHDKYLTSYVRYTQAEGIALGSWKDGFDGISWSKLINLITGNGEFEWSTKSIDLSFTGVPDRISFSTQLQVVEFEWINEWKEARLTADKFILSESADGVDYTSVQTKEGTVSFNEALKPTTRYIRIEYKGNFTGFIKNLQISRKQYITSTDNLTFGTETHPLQESQPVTIHYSSLGTCAEQSGDITVSTDNDAFYVDTETITTGVGIDQQDEATVRVRCNDINKTGHVVFTAFDGTECKVPVHSTNVVLTSAHYETNIFQTGTEHKPADGTAYRAVTTPSFNSIYGTQALFDTLYIYGVTEAAKAHRAWELDVQKGYNVPAFTATDGETAGTAYTPCFVFAKSGNDYVYVRTFDAATKSLNINADGKKLWFTGYHPVASTAIQPAIAISGNADIYLSNTEITAIGTVLTAKDGTLTVHARGTNGLNVIGDASAISLDANSTTALVIEDSWLSEASAVLNPNGAAGKPTIDLGTKDNSVTINGTQITLKNGEKMAVAYLKDGVEQVEGAVAINDGTILGEAELGLPATTTIDGGTFNDGKVRVYEKQGGKGTLPRNSNDEILGRYEMAPEAVPATYGHAHLTADTKGKVYPMLKNNDIYIFEEEKNEGAWTAGENWNKDNAPSETDIVIVQKNVVVSTSVTVASLTIEKGGSLTIGEGGSVTITENGYDQFKRSEYGDLTVKQGGSFETNKSSFEVKNFYIEAAIGDNTYAAKSGEVKHAESLIVDGDAYFDLVLDQSGKCSPGWYDFTVPFEVDGSTGISRYQDNAWNNSLKVETHYAIMAHYEDLRAAGQYSWKKYRGVLYPNQCYTITINNTAPLYRFHKRAGAPVIASKVLPLQVTEGESETRGFNALGNGNLAIRDLDVASDFKVQLYDHKDNAYTAYTAGAVKFAVGSAFFVQVKDANVGTLNLRETNASKALRVAERTPRTVSEFTLELTANGAEKAADRLFVSASEEATDTYEIGHDLSKYGNPSEAKRAQLWCNAYGMQLCDAELPLVDNTADFAIGLYAPEAGMYMISVAGAPEAAEIYLTNEAGEAIWNLSVSEYALDLSKGTTNGYGLRIVAQELVEEQEEEQEQEQEEITTALKNKGAKATNVRKQLINGVLYIQREGAIYDATGKRVQ